MPVIGFCGAPWTLMAYMIEGGGSKDRMKARALAWDHPERFDALMDRLAEATVRYLAMQARQGAEVLKLFDSWAEGLSVPFFERAVLRPTRAIVDGLRAAGIDQPVIGFARGCGSMLPRYARETGITAIALDQGVDPVWADQVLPAGMPVQGQLDPAALLAGACTPQTTTSAGSDAPMQSAEASACATRGGAMKQVGRMQSWQCVISYADAGKRCTDGAQCQGDDEGKLLGIHCLTPVI